MGKLVRKTAIITGGASGIGARTAYEMLKENGNVVIADVNEELGHQLVKKLELDGYGSKVFFEKVDVSNEEEVVRLIENTIRHFGSLDILFNNAGINRKSATTALSFEDWNKVVSVNLDAAFLMSKHALKVMKENGGGSIINTASILGSVGESEMVAYTATKGALVNMTKALALEYAKDKIRVNAISPGYIETPLIANADKERLISLHPIGRLGKPEEIAKVVVFLASEDASFITGANLLVDGGYTAR